MGEAGFLKMNRTANEVLLFRDSVAYCTCRLEVESDEFESGKYSHVAYLVHTIWRFLLRIRLYNKICTAKH